MKKVSFFILVFIILIVVIGCANSKIEDEVADTESVLEEGETEQRTFEDDVMEYEKEFKVRLSWKDVQYDMPNNLNKEFLVAGVAELSDYYNYGFRGIEEDYFCVNVIPYDGKFSNRWHLYFHRESFKELFDSLKEGERLIIATCEIPDFIYKEGQGNMACVNRARW